ncbi:sensor histidine kinase [Sporosarcina limicola]|uniref:histidine kinase n=1 Tax=Sporosarcina limicola TaxID=34101 RepID=A0A927R3N0_9BACL|nr:HAMP domain-containing sensor histidine kinase [Sporosarcina limicola]MBE1555286.1 signal transduction histidine kinase [Sporosarcina limicola]
MKKNNRVQLFVWTSLMAVFLMAVFSFIERGSQYIGKSYIEQDEFQQEMDNFYSSIGYSVLNPIDIEAEKKRISVSKSEIEEHRNRYGTLSEQIGNIEEQYKGRIIDAEAGKSEKLKTALIDERNTKIDDIRQNFEDDTHVETKIRDEKAKEFERYWKNRMNNLEGSINLPIAYEFEDIKTGESFSSGNVDLPAAYEKIFNLNEGYFKANSIDMSDHDLYQLRGIYDDGAVMQYEKGMSLTLNPTRTFEGKVIVPESALKEGSLSGVADNYNRTQYAMYILWWLGILALAALLTVFRFKKVWMTGSRFSERYDRVKIDMRIALLIISLCGVFILLNIVPELYSYFFFQNNVGSWIELCISFIFLLFFLWGTIFQLVNIFERLKIEGALEQDIKDSFTVKFFIALQGMFLNRSIGIQMSILFIGFFLAGIGFVGVMVIQEPEAFLIYMILVLFTGLPILYFFVKRVAYLNRIIVATEAMAEGRLHKEIEVEGKSPLAKHAANLNNLREGVRVSMSEQAKSERLKTELITNVSHDLRTPLTSIITYTDLLKNEDLPVEERAKYVDILDKKSQRLKTLIEDLFEVSKMASGNLELNKQRVDLTQLLQQALAEHAEEISNTALDFRTTFPDTALIAYVDGKRWWRVLDNLIVNAIKYTLPGTRVYITLRKVGDNAEFVVKNVTKYELDENVDELFERFKRADTSRHTDGSGLGLAIAQSIVDMHNGNMKIEVDGDLFKVTVNVLASY